MEGPPHLAPPGLAPARLGLIAESFQRLLGRPLVAGLAGHAGTAGAAEALAQALWNAPAVIVAHGTEPDPVFFYGNRRALELFEMDAEAFTRLPSRHSAEAPLREERARLLERVQRDGFIADYAGVRISASGRRFRIEQAVVWNLVDAQGHCHGQAATFDRWTTL